VFHNPINKKFPFIDLSVRNYRANLANLIGLIQRCWAFVGVASGPFVAAMSVMPERTFYLEKYHKLETYTSLEIARADILKYDKGSVIRWLETLANSNPKYI